MDPESRQGYLGNLENKTTEELRDLLSRQEKLMKKRNFLNTLPDRGEKIQHFVQKLKSLIEKREKVVYQLNSQKLDKEKELRTMTASTTSEVTGISKFKSSKVLRQDDTLSGLVLEKFSEPEDMGDGDIGPDLGDMETCQATCDSLEQTFENLNVTDKPSGHSRDVVHFYEIAEERAKYNSLNTDFREPFKTNSTLKISRIENLPSKFKQSRQQKAMSEPKSDLKMETNKLGRGDGDGPLGWDYHSESGLEGGDSSVTPPKYQFNKAKQISLDESVLIQRRHKAKQEELQAQAAAERLAQRVNITMETYSPEGVDMSYREVQQEIDSDDDLEGVD